MNLRLSEAEYAVIAEAAVAAGLTPAGFAASAAVAAAGSGGGSGGSSDGWAAVARELFRLRRALVGLADASTDADVPARVAATVAQVDAVVARIGWRQPDAGQGPQAG